MTYCALYPIYVDEPEAVGLYLIESATGTTCNADYYYDWLVFPYDKCPDDCFDGCDISNGPGYFTNVAPSVSIKTHTKPSSAAKNKIKNKLKTNMYDDVVKGLFPATYDSHSQTWKPLDGFSGKGYAAYKMDIKSGGATVLTNVQAVLFKADFDLWTANHWKKKDSTGASVNWPKIKDVNSGLQWTSFPGGTTFGTVTSAERVSAYRAKVTLSSGEVYNLITTTEIPK